MIVSIVKAIIMCFVFVIIIAVLAKLSGAKLRNSLKEVIKLLKVGSKEEFSSRAGLISLITVILVGGLAAMVILVHETKSFLFDTFQVQYSKENYISIGIFSTMGAALLNFIFIALIRFIDSRDTRSN